MNRLDLDNKTDLEVKELADQGNKVAMMEYAIRLRRKEQYQEAFNYLYPLKDIDNTFIWELIIDLAYYEIPGVISDKELFLLTLRRHSKGISFYTYILAKMYKDGKGTRKSLKKYIEMLTLCAYDGSASATIELAHCYEEGYGVRKSYRKAYKLYNGYVDEHFKKDYYCAYQVALYQLERKGGIKKDMNDIKYHLWYASRIYPEAKELYIQLFNENPEE